MRNLRKLSIAVILIVTVLIGVTSCTKNNQVLDLTTPTPSTPPLNTDTLYSVIGTPTVLPIGGGTWTGGIIEPIWANAPVLNVTAQVPDKPMFDGFIGNSTNVTIQSMHDASYIYFLVQWDCPQFNCASSPWYFNPTTRLWAQEKGAPVKNADSVTFRPPFQQDQFTMAFNVNNSCLAFKAKSCWAVCHDNSTFDTPGNVTVGSTMYTNGPSEVLDCWRARTLQVINCNQANDVSITNGGGTLNKNSFVNDAQLATTDGGFSNKQTLTIPVWNTKVSVPLWVIPSGVYTNGAIKATDTLPGGNAVKVLGVDSNGVLTLPAPLAPIDPRTSASGNAYQQVGNADGSKCIPGSVVAPYTGSRGDVTANAYYTGSGYRMLLKRALTTTDAVYDVDFSKSTDYPFGLGVMYDGANGQHAIVAGLTLHLK